VSKVSNIGIKKKGLMLLADLCGKDFEHPKEITCIFGVEHSVLNQIMHSLRCLCKIKRTWNAMYLPVALHSLAK